MGDFCRRGCGRNQKILQLTGNGGHRVFSPFGLKNRKRRPVPDQQKSRGESRGIFWNRFTGKNVGFIRVIVGDLDFHSIFNRERLGISHICRNRICRGSCLFLAGSGWKTRNPITFFRMIGSEFRAVPGRQPPGNMPFVRRLGIPFR